MSNKRQDAAQEVHAVARGFRAVIALADQLEGIGSLEQAESEARTRLEAVRAEVSAAEVLRDGIGAEQEAAEGRVRDLIAAAQARAAAIIDGATSQAAIIVDEARERSASMMASAEAQVVAAKDEAAAVAAAHESLAAVRDQVQAEQAKLDAARGAIAALLHGVSG